MSVMHILHRSVPGTHGYAIRSREIVRNIRQKGIDQIVLTSPSQPPLGTLDAEQSELIDGTRYFRTCNKIFPPTAEVSDESPLKSSLRVLQNFSMLKTAMRLAGRYRPAVIHAHSPFTCGIVANVVGRLKGIPTIYEVRGIWEASHAGRGRFTESSLRYKAVHWLEDRAIKGAGVCCTICEGLANEIKSRGVSDDKIVVVPNGVDVKAFVPGPPPAQLKMALGLEDSVTVGYIGYFFSYEALDLLVRAIDSLVGEFPRLRLLLVGGGESMPMLRELADHERLRGRIVFAGRVRYEEVMDYYRVCDFFVLPRKETPETRLVTPLKPLEIMAMGKTVLASDIGGHRELIVPGLNGLLFKSGDLPDLTDKCRLLLQNQELRHEIGQRSRKWVEDNRDWSVLADRYISLYSRLAGRAAV